MKKYSNFIIVVFGFIAKINGLPADIDDGGSWPFSQDDGRIRWMTGEEELIEQIPTELISDTSPDRIHFFLYTQGNFSDPVEIDINDVETLVRSGYDFRNPTTFMIHGWKDQYSGGANSLIRKSLFQSGQNRQLNFISVDWRVYSQFKNYVISQQLCSVAGKVVAQFIDWMHDNAKLQFNTLTLYGHSMGAQVAGFAGKNVQRGRIHSIIGMDPALPLFPYSNPKRRLADTDAEYVESIHTNGGYWGFYKPIGQTAFYPNGGKYQPGCGSDDDGSCSHQRAVYYLAEALSSHEENQFHAVKCDQLEDVAESKCDRYETIIRMGDPRNAQKPRGIYYLETNSVSPYAMGFDNIFKKKLEINKNIRS